MQKTHENNSVLKKNNLESKLETRRCIKTALLQLLKEKKFNEIRMTDIIRKSGVSRMGVYNNYKNKDEIMLDLYKEPLEAAASSLGTSISANLTFIFQTAYRHKDTVRTLIDSGLAPIFLDVMNKRFEDTSKSFYFSIWNGLAYNAVIEWIKSGTDEMAESAVARMIDDLSLLAKAIETEIADEKGN